VSNHPGPPGRPRTARSHRSPFCMKVAYSQSSGGHTQTMPEAEAYGHGTRRPAHFQSSGFSAERAASERICGRTNRAQSLSRSRRTGTFSTSLESQQPGADQRLVFRMSRISASSCSWVGPAGAGAGSWASSRLRAVLIAFTRMKTASATIRKLMKTLMKSP